MTKTQQATKPTAALTICGPNLRDDSKGTFHVHAAGCADLKNYGPRKPLGGERPTTAALTSVQEVVEFIYSDMIGEQDGAVWQDYANDFHFLPCTNPIIKPVAAKRTRKPKAEAAPAVETPAPTPAAPVEAEALPIRGGFVHTPKRVAALDRWVEVVRADHIVGTGTVSCIAEAYTDEELREMFDLMGARNVDEAVMSARKVHRVWNAQQKEIAAA